MQANGDSLTQNEPDINNSTSVPAIGSFWKNTGQLLKKKKVWIPAVIVALGSYIYRDKLFGQSNGSDSVADSDSKKLAFTTSVTPSKTSSNIIWIVMAVFGVLLIAGASYYFLLFSKKNGSQRDVDSESGKSNKSRLVSGSTSTAISADSQTSKSKPKSTSDNKNRS